MNEKSKKKIAAGNIETIITDVNDDRPPQWLVAMLPSILTFFNKRKKIYETIGLDTQESRAMADASILTAASFFNMRIIRQYWIVFRYEMNRAMRDAFPFVRGKGGRPPTISPNTVIFKRPHPFNIIFSTIIWGILNRNMFF